MFKQKLSQFAQMVAGEKASVVKQQQYHDKRLSEYYHKVDLKKKPDMYTGYKRYCELMEILQERTAFKRKTHGVISTCDKLLSVLKEVK